MKILLQQFKVLHCETILRDDFDDNQFGWEITKADEEQSFIKDGYYWMENSSNSQWKYYRMKILPRQKEGYLIDTYIDVLSSNHAAHCGLIWGFDKSREILNRFTVSADGTRALIQHFQKDHHRVYHRFHTRKLTAPKEKSVRLSIAKAGDYFYFLHNGNLIYSCHIAHFTDSGPYVGYYVEPGLFIRSAYIEVKRLLTEPVENKSFDELLNPLPVSH